MRYQVTLLEFSLPGRNPLPCLALLAPDEDSHFYPLMDCRHRVCASACTSGKRPERAAQGKAVQRLTQHEEERVSFGQPVIDQVVEVSDDICAYSITN